MIEKKFPAFFVDVLSPVRVKNASTTALHGYVVSQQAVTFRSVWVESHRTFTHGERRHFRFDTGDLFQETVEYGEIFNPVIIVVIILLEPRREVVVKSLLQRGMDPFEFLLNLLKVEFNQRQAGVIGHLTRTKHMDDVSERIAYSAERSTNVLKIQAVYRKFAEIPHDHQRGNRQGTFDPHYYLCIK